MKIIGSIIIILSSIFASYFYEKSLKNSIRCVNDLIELIKAIKNKYRIKEKTLVMLSLLFGSIGGLIGMYVIRHKNRHFKFIFTNWLFFIIHIVIGYFILTYAI